MTPEPILLELGFDLVPFAKQNLGGTLVERIARLREEMQLKIGIILPPIRIRDNFEIGGNQFLVFIKRIRVSQLQIYLETDSSNPPYEAPDVLRLIIEHLRELFLKYAPELIDYEQINILLEQHAVAYPNLIREFNRTFPQKSTLLKILRNLLREGHSIRNMPVILETLLEIGPKQSPENVANLVRTHLGCSSC